MFTMLSLGVIFATRHLYKIVKVPHQYYNSFAVKELKTSGHILPTETGIMYVPNYGHTQLKLTITQLESMKKLAEIDGYIIVKMQEKE